RPRGRHGRGRRPVVPLTLSVGSGPARLDTFLNRALPELSRRLVRRLIVEGAVRLNGRPAAKGSRVVPGDRVTLPDLPPAIAPEPGLALPVLYEDDALVALDKPGGMPGTRSIRASAARPPPSSSRATRRWRASAIRS